MNEFYQFQNENENPFLNCAKTNPNPKQKSKKSDRMTFGISTWQSPMECINAGMDGYIQEKELIDWLASQTPQLIDAFWRGVLPKIPLELIGV
jgi:hypothetical protein